MAKNEIEPADQEDFGPAMLACLERERILITGIFEGLSGAEAARRAGYECTSPENFARVAHRALHRDRVQAAIVEYTAKAARTLGPMAIRAQSDILSTINHKDRAKVSIAVLERITPTVQRTEATLEVTHKVDHDGEAIAQLRMLKALNVTREKLQDVFGFSGLSRYEKLLALEDARTAPQFVDAEFTEIDAVTEYDL